MSTLTEIAAAAETLPAAEKVELIRLLEANLNRARGSQSPGHSPTNDFAGVLKSSEDALKWQNLIREEWS